MPHVLIDLERTMGSGRTHYWKRSKHGYTTDLREAGAFSDREAADIVTSDRDNMTVMVGESVVKKILEGR
jgi:hypothetical protein